MQPFREYYAEQEFVDFVINEFDQPKAASQPKGMSKSATKDQIMYVWNQLQPNTPIRIQPMQPDSIGTSDNSSYGEDGIRITGSWGFIASVIAKLKELLQYENEATRLRLVFRGVDPSRATVGKKSFVFYVNLENRQKRNGGIGA
jgi:hypothetical protein